MHRLNLDKAEYKGKFSQLDPTPQSRHKANKRKPRTRTIATSDCYCYNSREDLEAENVARVIPINKPRQTRERAVAERVTAVRQHQTAKQEFAQRWLSQHPLQGEVD